MSVSRVVVTATPIVAVLAMATGQRVWIRQSASVLDDGLEAAPEHASGVERQGGRIHVRQAGILHHRRVDAVPFLARGVADPGEHHHLVGLELDRLRERGDLAGLDVIGNALDVFQGAVLEPDPAGCFRERAVVVDPVLRYRKHETIHMGHCGFLLGWPGRSPRSKCDGWSSAVSTALPDLRGPRSTGMPAASSRWHRDASAIGLPVRIPGAPGYAGRRRVRAAEIAWTRARRSALPISVPVRPSARARSRAFTADAAACSRHSSGPWGYSASSLPRRPRLSASQQRAMRATWPGWRKASQRSNSSSTVWSRSSARRCT